MFERFPRSSRRVVQQARDEAAELGSPNVEAEHVLLALARDSDPVVRRVLDQAGIHHEGLVEALEAQERAALAAVGVSREEVGLPSRRPPLRRTPAWSTSSKQTIGRAHKVAVARHDRRIEPGHLLLAILRSEAGPVSRTLAFAGADPVGLAARTESELERDI